MKLMHAVIFATSVLAMMLFAPLGMAAGLHVSGAHSFHAGGHSIHRGGHFRSARQHRAQWPGYGFGYGGVYATYTPDTAATYTTTPQTIVYVREFQSALTCKHSQETKTVPSESGGTREITITRC